MFDAIVIGVGSFGAAACDQLAMRGLRVLGLEQFEIANTRASHHGKSRLFRTAYYEHSDYVPLLQRAYTLWRDLESRSCETLFHETGALYMGTTDSELIAGSLRAAQTYRLPHRELSGADLRREYPQFALPDDHIGFFESRAGFIQPERSIVAMVQLARSRGATILEGQRVLGWDADPAGVTVSTETGRHSARSLIITAGAWSSRLLESVDVQLRVTRQIMGWVRPMQPGPFLASNHFPCWAIGYQDGSLHYGFPMMPGDESLKLALHAEGRPAHPDQLDRHITRDDEHTFRSVLKCIPQAEGPTARACACMYTNSPDGHFIIDRHPSHPNVAFACGSSGHGFKFAPVIGEALADLVTSGASELPIDFLSLRRFQR